jgi:phospholipid/cholesterol/gamma-HCH transport system substrate-binding protein
VVSTIRAGANVVQGINLKQLEQALVATDQDLEAIPPGATSDLLQGLSQLSDVIASRSGELAQLVQNVSQLTATLDQHGTQLFSLIGQSDLVLQVLNQRHTEIDQLLKSTAALTQQLQALLAAHQAQVGPLLADLQTVTGVLAKDGSDIAAAIPLLTGADKYLANVTGSGMFGDFVMPAGLIPDNVIAQCAKPGAVNPLTGCNP